MTVEQITNQIPSWGKYIIEDYYHKGVIYGKNAVLEKNIMMIIAKEDVIMIYI